MSSVLLKWLLLLFGFLAPVGAGANAGASVTPGTVATAPATPTATTAPATPTHDPTTSGGTGTAAPTATTAPTTSAPAATPTFPGSAAEQAAAAYILQQYNAYRAQAGVPPLSADLALSKVSYAHSQEMQQTGKLQHESVSGQNPCQRITAAGISWRTCEENIAWNRGYTTVKSGIADNLKDMMAEPLNQGSNHHTNIISPHVTKVGIGVSIVGSNVYWTTDFIGY